MNRKSFSFKHLACIGFIGAFMTIPASGCIIVDDDNCIEGSLTCHGDFIEECVDDVWVEFDNCAAGWCGGTCDYLDGEPACFCP